MFKGIQMKILILLNLFILFFGVVSWMDAYNPERAMVSVALIVAGVVNFILIVTSKLILNCDP